MKKIRNYTELSKLKTFEERFDYLKLSGEVGIETYGFDRYINQFFYNSAEWRKARRAVIIRDESCDLGIPDRMLDRYVIVHHMNPISEEDINQRRDEIFNPEYLVCTSRLTHNAIHYGDSSLLIPSSFVERKPNDTIPWR